MAYDIFSRKPILGEDKIQIFSFKNLQHFPVFWNRALHLKRQILPKDCYDLQLVVSTWFLWNTVLFLNPTSYKYDVFWHLLWVFSNVNVTFSNQMSNILTSYFFAIGFLRICKITLNIISLLNINFIVRNYSAGLFSKEQVHLSYKDLTLFQCRFYVKKNINKLFFPEISKHWWLLLI